MSLDILKKFITLSIKIFLTYSYAKFLFQILQYKKIEYLQKYNKQWADGVKRAFFHRTKTVESSD